MNRPCQTPDTKRIQPYNTTPPVLFHPAEVIITPIRFSVGGKHNDLEDVGKDVYHHTFFEMLGNWSFGDYFKADAIEWAWDLLTRVYKIDPERLYVTYFAGNDQVECDTEARDIWLKYLPASRVLPFDAKDNFWEMGDVGPCGPCSEIHYDRIGGRDAASLVNMDDPDVLEIWNLVFIQYNRKPDGNLEKLPDCHVDTGCGFERLASVLQGYRSNYDTDIFAPIFAAIAKLAEVRPYEGKVDAEDKDNIDMGYRVVADHIRTLTFAIADGAVPSNDGRGYVLRRVLRRAVRYSQDVLKMPKGSFSSLVSVVVSVMHGAFPEIKAKEKYIIEILMEEEATFQRTLKRGIEFFGKSIQKLLTEGQKTVDGPLAFKMYESMGFPLDLTELMAEEHGLNVDRDGYAACMQQHVEVSKKRKPKAVAAFKPFEAKQTSALEQKSIPATIHTVYQQADVTTKLLAIYDPRTETFVDQASPSQPYGFVLETSSMYYESGGQVADEGAVYLEGDESNALAVQDVQHAKGYIIHLGQASENCSLQVGATVVCAVDYGRRMKIARNHTGTHLLNWALRKVIGGQVDQAGSINTDEYLRFDFSAKKGLSDAQVEQVEELLMKKIEAAEAVDSKPVPLEETKKIASLRAVFGETYPDPVRVVAVGAKVDDILADPKAPKWENVSIELCGGTHVSNSSSLRKMVIISEEAKGKGVRRIVAYTDEKALEAARKGEEYFKMIEDCKEVKVLSEEIKNALIPSSLKKTLLALLLKKKMSLVEEEKKELARQAEECAATLKKSDRPASVLAIRNTSVNASKLAKAVQKKVPKVSICIICLTTCKSIPVSLPLHDD